MLSAGEGSVKKVTVQFHTVTTCETLQSLAEKYQTTPEWLVRNNPWIDTYEVALRLQNVRYPVKIEKSDRLYQVSEKLGGLDADAANCLWPGLLEEYDRAAGRERVAKSVELWAPKSLPGPSQPVSTTERQARFFVQTKSGDNLNEVAYRLGTTRSRLHQLFPALSVAWLEGGEYTSDYHHFEVLAAGVGLMISPQETLPSSFLKSGSIRLPDNVECTRSESTPGACHSQEMQSDWFEKRLRQPPNQDRIYAPRSFGLIVTM